MLPYCIARHFGFLCLSTWARSSVLVSGILQHVTPNHAALIIAYSASHSLHRDKDCHRYIHMASLVMRSALMQTPETLLKGDILVGQRHSVDCAAMKSDRTSIYHALTSSRFGYGVVSARIRSKKASKQSRFRMSSVSTCSMDRES